jgi:hypothetical protein
MNLARRRVSVPTSTGAADGSTCSIPVIHSGVTRMVCEVIGDPLLVRSTSWRRDREAVILSFVAVIDRTLVGSMLSLPIERTTLARGEATAAPQAIATTQVVEHGLRHMAWLAVDDPVVAAELPAGWRTLLATYVPEPFRNLG